MSFSHKNGKNVNSFQPWNKQGERPARDLGYLRKSGVSVHAEMAKTMHRPGFGTVGENPNDVRRFD